MAQTPTITLLEPTVRVVLIEGFTIPVDNIAWAGEVFVKDGQAYSSPTDGTSTAYRVRFRSGGHVDLHGVTADGFASALAGAPF